MTGWSDDRMTWWSDGQKSGWPDNQMTRWIDGQMAGWSETKWSEDGMARRRDGWNARRPYGQKSRWYIKQILKKWCSQCYTGYTPNVLPELLTNRTRNPFGLVNSTFSVINDSRTSWILDVCLPYARYVAKWNYANRISITNFVGVVKPECHHAKL